MVDAPADACTLGDPASVACGAEWSSLLADWVGDATASTCPWDRGYSFHRRVDFLDFFRQMAVAMAMVDPAYGVDCTSTVQWCTYDPTVQQLSPQDVHYSNTGEFIAPDGQPYVWRYERSQNLWFTAARLTSPRSYDLFVARNEACPINTCPAACSCGCGG